MLPSSVANPPEKKIQVEKLRDCVGSAEVNHLGSELSMQTEILVWWWRKRPVLLQRNESKTTTLFMYRPSRVTTSSSFAHCATQDCRDDKRLAPMKYEDAVPKHDLTRFEVSLYIELGALRKVLRATWLSGKLKFFFRRVVSKTFAFSFGSLDDYAWGCIWRCVEL